MPFLSKRNTNLEYGKNACLFFLLGVAGLECVRHQARWFILTVRINHRAMCLSHLIPATPNRNKNKHFSETPNLYFFC